MEKETKEGESPVLLPKNSSEARISRATAMKVASI